MVHFARTMERHRVAEWASMYVDYEALKTFVTALKELRDKGKDGATTEDDDLGGGGAGYLSGRESIDAEAVWARCANAPKLSTELNERGKANAERVALEETWESLGMELDDFLEVKSTLEDQGNGVPNALRQFYEQLDVQVNKCNKFYETLVEIQAKHLASALLRIDVISAALDAETPTTSSKESEVATSEAAGVCKNAPHPTPQVPPLRRHVRSGSATTASGTDLHEFFKQNNVIEGHERASKAAQAIRDDAQTFSPVTLTTSREKATRALLHDIKEIYYSVCMIQNFSTLNAVAIRKITKKVDKEAFIRTSGIYCTACDQLAFWPDVKESTFQCNTMIKLCERAFLTCHLLLRRIKAVTGMTARITSMASSQPEKSGRTGITRKEREGLLETLRETGRRIKDDGLKANIDRESNGNPLLFFLGGFFWGVAFPSLMIPLWYLVFTCGLESTDETCRKELAAFVTLRGFLLIFGQSLLWGPAVYVWQRTMVHWELIFFGSVGKTGLRAEHAILATVFPWLLCVLILTASTVLWSLGKENTLWVTPISLIIFITCIIPAPESWKWANDPRMIFIQPPMATRRFLLRHVIRVISAPWHFVLFPDFFVADQLTSHSTAIADLTVTFGLAGDTASTRAIAATVPLWFRLAQSFRRARDAVVCKRGGRPRGHLLNAGKYAFSILALWLRYYAAHVNADDHSVKEWIVAYFFTAFSVCYSLCWDYFCDWTIVAYNPKSSWRVELLPRRTLVKSNAAWGCAVAFNTLARSAALFAAVPGLPFDNLSTQVLVTALAAVEVLRRAVWNIFRVENEHSSNCGAFRASGDSAFEALEDPFVAHVDELSKELRFVPRKGSDKV